ncbi:hypothetical protein ACIBEJ_51625 [Nonomuraea sp. NPDC050790]|uniref:hypothetical protein n=1 Tax=Nonomuraea sp. NPDC050790 TaxID=3364371 RepID=UPI00379364EB
MQFVGEESLAMLAALLLSRFDNRMINGSPQAKNPIKFDEPSWFDRVTCLLRL